MQKTIQKKKPAVVAPGKKTMNFVHHKSCFNPRRVLPVVLVLLIAAAAFVKFGILDPIDKKTAALSELSVKQSQLAVINQKLSGYDDLKKQYGRYSYGWMNETETGLVSRMDILDLVEKKIAPTATITDIAVNNNVLTLNIFGLTLEQASGVVRSLEQSNLVQRASVYSAVAEEADQASIYMSIVVAKEAEEE